MKHNFNDHSPECCGPKFPPFCPEDKPPMGRPPMPPCGPMPPCPSVVSGMDLYEAVNNLTDRVNVCIHNYNAVMAESYKTLHNLQQAAQENGAYYGPDEVWVEEGYYANESSTYHLVHKACVDRRGEPIRMQLHLAYGNTTNSKIEQGIFNASKLEFADKMLVAIPKGENGWYGKAIWHGSPIQSAEEPTLYTVGFTRAGVMRVYNNGVSVDQMLRDTIENAMGCSGVLIQNGQLTDDSCRANIPNAGQQTSRVCIGQNLDTREVIILTVGNENDVNRKGLTSKACAAILLGQGCDIAVELCEGVGSAAMDKGSLMYVPDDEQQPNAYAFWFISRKCFYKTDYERELAELIQNYGACIWDGFLNKKNIESVKNDLDAEIARAVAAENALGERVTEEVTRAKGEEQRIEGKVDVEIQRAKDAEAELQESINDETLRAKGEEQRIDGKLDAEVKRATDAEDELGVRIDAEVNRAKAEEQRIDGKVDAESARAKAAEAGLQSALDKEVHDRTNGDSVLHQEILTEQGERTAADTVLQNNINSEASTRATEDGKLQASIDAEAKARASADSVLQSNIDSEASTRATEDGKLQANIDAEIQTRTSEDAKLKAALDGKIEALTSRVTQCETDIHQLDSLTSQMQQQMSGLDKSVSDMLVTVSKLEVAMENVKQTVLNMNTVVAECNAKVEALDAKVNGMTSGQTELPYVKKAGDTMTGPLVMADSAGAAKGSVATADGGVSLKAANGAFVKVDGSQVTIGDNAGNSVKLQGIYAATKDNEAVNYYQLKQKADSSDVSDISAVANAANSKADEAIGNAAEAGAAASAADAKATQASAAASAADTKATQASQDATTANTNALQAADAAATADAKATQAAATANAAKKAADDAATTAARASNMATGAQAAADDAGAEAAQANADVAEIVAGTKVLPYVKDKTSATFGIPSNQTALECTNSVNQELAGAEARMGTGFAAKSVGGIATMFNFWTMVNVNTIPDDGIVRWTVPLTKPAKGFRLMVCNPLYYLHSGETHTVIGMVNISIDHKNNILCEFHRSDNTKTSVSIVMQISALALVTE
nr:MAG TPA: Phosphodiester glycosidase [Caudoviricetes sp.]